MIKASDITKYLSYAPQHQMAFPGGVPYNVVNSEGLKEQLIMARVESKGTGEVTPKKEYVPDWLKERWEAGNNFNKENRPRYPYKNTLID